MNFLANALRQMPASAYSYDDDGRLIQKPSGQEASRQYAERADVDAIEPAMIQPDDLLGTGIPKGLAMAIFRHGSPNPLSKAIREAGELLPRKSTGKKASGGQTSEEGLVYLTDDAQTARNFADESTHPDMLASSQWPEKGYSKGAVFETPDIDPYLMDYDKPLTEAQADIINEFLPDYKPIKAGENLSTAVNYRSNGKLDWATALKALGYDGFKRGNEIALAADSIPVKQVEDLTNFSPNPMPYSDRARVDVKETPELDEIMKLLGF